MHQCAQANAVYQSNKSINGIQHERDETNTCKILLMRWPVLVCCRLVGKLV